MGVFFRVGKRLSKYSVQIQLVFKLNHPGCFHIEKTRVLLVRTDCLWDKTVFDPFSLLLALAHKQTNTNTKTNTHNLNTHQMLPLLK